jgi:hypothetical protein
MVETLQALQESANASLRRMNERNNQIDLRLTHLEQLVNQIMQYLTTGITPPRTRQSNVIYTI